VSSVALHNVHDVADLTRRTDLVVQKAVKLHTLRDSVQSDADSCAKKIRDLDAEIEILSKVGELFHILMDQLVNQQVRSVERVATEGLHTVFHDLNLSLESDVGPKYNKISVEFAIRRGTLDDPFSHVGPPLDSFGGGPSSVVSLILRILAIKKLKLWPFLILDESLAAVSDDYVDAAGRFIRDLADRLGFDVLLVTQKTAFLDHAHSAYRCQEEEVSDGTHLVLRRA
jgi:hypothetical protein